jgi:hypothetical protein
LVIKEIDNKIEISEEDDSENTDKGNSLKKEKYKDDQPGKGKDLPD